MSVTYGAVPADGWVVLAAGGAVLFYPGADHETTATLWDAIRSEDPVQSCLEALTRRGLNSAPPFVLASWSGVEGTDAVVLARGIASATITTTNGPVALDGASVTTWLEKRVSGVSGLLLGQRPANVLSLPLEAGVAFAAWVELGRADTAPGAVRIPEPVAAPVPVPVPVPEAGPAAAVAEPNVLAAPAPESTITELPDAAVSSDAAGGYAHLFEETVVRNIEDAAVRPPEENDHEDVAPEHEVAPPEGDHDGLTLMSGDLAQLRTSRRVAPEAAVAREPQPVLRYFLDVSTGGREPLIHSVLVGRSPSVTKISSGQVPRLITIPGDKDISRNHTKLSLEGGTVVVTDLHSRNGTSVILPGKSPQSLRAGEPTPVIPGTIVDLGGGVRLTIIEETE